MSDRVQSIERAIDILMSLVRGPKTLTQVSRDTGLSKGTTFRGLASLGYESVVVKDGNQYILGPGALRLMQGVAEGFGSMTAIARPTLSELWQLSGETVTVHVRVGLERMCVEEFPSAAALRYISTVGATAPLHVGAAGRILLAFLEPDELLRIVGELPFGQITEATIRDRETLLSELAIVRERGYATSAGERVQGAAAISVPVFGRNDFLASLSILGPDFRLTEDREQEMLPELLRAAEVVGAALLAAGEPKLAVLRVAETGT